MLTSTEFDVSVWLTNGTCNVSDRRSTMIFFFLTLYNANAYEHTRTIIVINTHEHPFHKRPLRD